MKTKHILITLMFFCIQNFAFSQEWRYADLRVQIISPEANTTYASPGVINFQFQVVNQGPDTIFQTDTLFYQPSHSYNVFSPVRKIAIPQLIAPQDSFVFGDTIKIDSRAFNKTFELSFSQVPMVYGPDAGKMRLVNEFSEDRDDNQASVKLFHSGNLSSKFITTPANSLTLFPNPTSNQNVVVNSDHPIQSLKVYNSCFQLILHKEYKLLNNKIEIPVTQMPSGIYFVQVNSNDLLSTKKLVIE